MSTNFFSLPPMEQTFTFSVEGDRSKVKWEGEFTYVRPTLGVRSEIYRTAARMGGDASPFLSEEGKGLNYTLAYLRHTLTTYPKWWVDSEYGTKLVDENILGELIRRATDAEREWENKLKAATPKKA